MTRLRARQGLTLGTVAAAAVVAVGLSCSTLAPLPTPLECESDEDCPNEGELCAPDTRVCVPETNVPPVADLAFDVQELVGGQVVYRAEIRACDQAVSISQSRLDVRASEVAQTFEVQAFVRDPVGDPAVEDLLPSAIEFSQASRFGRTPLAPPRVDYPRIEPGAEVVSVLPTTLKWPRYHPFDPMPPELAGGGFVLWRTIPVDGAPVLQMLVPPATVPSQGDENMPCDGDLDCCDDPDACPVGSCLPATGLCAAPCDDDLDCCDDEESCAPNFCVLSTGECSAIGNPNFAFAYRYEDTCSRELTGEVVVIDGQTLETRGVVADVPLTVRHADTLLADRLGVHAIGAIAPDQRPPECSTDADCIVGDQFCDPTTKQCVLRLAGRPADDGSVRTAEDGTFLATVYTYCSPEQDNRPVTRSFTVSATPTGPLASLSYSFDTMINPVVGGTKPQARVPKRLCVPDWGPSAGLSLKLAGEPRVLAGTGDDAYRCCDVGCLPRTPEELAVSNPPEVTTCDGRITGGSSLEGVTVEASLVLDEAAREAWEAADCLVPEVGPDDVVGGIRRSMDCSAPDESATCIAADLAAGPDGDAREYVVRFESPVGSLFASASVPVDLIGDATSAELPLLPRVLVRGRVVLDDEACAQTAPVDGECGAQAIVRAERLRMPGESPQTVLGPYFHEVTTFVAPDTGEPGHYLMPLDPGVYLMTALPAAGSAGGPAPISVLDLRDGADVERDLSLPSGVLVTLDLSGFDPRAQILPLDLGSWRDLVHPGRADHPDETRRVVDLNAIGECLQPSTEEPQACRIRRLIAGSTLAASQVGQVRFLARSDPGATSCPQ